MAQVDRRQSKLTVLFIGSAIVHEFTFWRWEGGQRRPLDLTAYDASGVRLQLMNSVTDATLREDYELALLTDDSRKVVDPVTGDLVVARAISNTPVLTGATGSGVLKTTLISGGVPELFDAPWDVTILAGGPTS